VGRVLGMLDETRALDALRRRYPVEDDPAVRNAITWAGKRLYQAQQAGYSTINEVFRYFNVDKEIENTPDAVEQELMDKMEDSLHRDLLDMQERGHRKKVGMAVAAGLGGMLVGGMGTGLTTMAVGLAAGARGVSTGADGRPEIGLSRTPPMAPSNSEIGIWVRRVHEGATPDQREQAAIQLSELNNPKALPHLAAVFVGDDSPQVRQAAQRFGKILYWRAVYWEMEQDGSLAEEMVRRAAALGKQIKASKIEPSAMPLPPVAGLPAGNEPQEAEPNVDVGEILRKAKAARKERKRKEMR
jgi:hypothetical protein